MPLTRSKENVLCLIQARIGSRRLPGKVVKNLIDKPVLEHIVERLRLSRMINEIVVTTGTDKRNDPIERLCQNIRVKCFRGSEEDVLKRFADASELFSCGSIVRVSGDSPCIDPYVIDDIIRYFKDHNVPLATNSGPKKMECGYPWGFDAEVFGYDVLQNAFRKAKKPYQHEHVTPFIYEHYKKDIYYLKNKENYSHLRFTLDTPEDYQFLKEVYRELYRGKHDFFLREIIGLLKKWPELFEINCMIKQRSSKESHRGLK